MATIYRIRVLAENIEETMKELNVKILVKKTITYHTARVGILDSPNIKYSNIE